jgi:hypothetical protein
MALAHRPGDRLDQVRRRQEPELVGVADIQIPHTLAGRLDLLRLGHDVPNGIGEPVDAECSTNRSGGGGARHDSRFYPTTGRSRGILRV